MPAVLIGKEGNRIEDRLTGLVGETSEYRSEYVDPEHTVWKELVVPVLNRMNRTHLARASGLDRRTIQRQLSGQVHPHLSSEQLLTALAIVHARESLASLGLAVPRDAMGALQRYLAQHQ